MVGKLWYCVAVAVVVVVVLVASDSCLTLVPGSFLLICGRLAAVLAGSCLLLS